MQHAYLRIARHCKPFAEEKDFSGWLSCVVRCAAVDHTRHSARRSLLAENFAYWRASQSGPDADWQASTNHIAELADAALAKLPAEDAVHFRPMLLTAMAVVVGASVILFNPIFHGLAISLMTGEIASLLISRMAVPVLYFMANRRGR